MQVTVYHNGELVADVVAGYADPEKTRKVTPDTLFPIFSVTKGVVATAAHIAAVPQLAVHAVLPSPASVRGGNLPADALAARNAKKTRW